MKIGIVSPNFPMRSDPHRAVYVYEAARRLAELADVRVFCPIAEYVGPFARLGPKAADQQGFTVSGVEVEYFGYPAIPVLSRATNGMVCARRLLPRVRAFSPDLLLCYWIFPEGYAGLLVGQRLGIPVIVRSIGSDLNRQSDVISRRFIRRTLQQAQFVLTASEQLRRRAIQFGATPERSRAVLNGCDASIFYPADKNAARAELQVPADARLVVFVGRVTREKGIF